MALDINIHNVSDIEFTRHEWKREDGTKYYSIDLKIEGFDDANITLFSDHELNLTKVTHEDPHFV